jgi:hypothetical protein
MGTVLQRAEAILIAPAGIRARTWEHRGATWPGDALMSDILAVHGTCRGTRATRLIVRAAFRTTGSAARDCLRFARQWERVEEMPELGSLRNEVIWTVMGCRMSGVMCCHLGEFIAARDYLERGRFLL